MNKTKIKKIILFITTYFAILLTAKAKTNNKNELYPYNEKALYDISPYSSYSNGYIYISDIQTIKDIIVDSNDLYIIDFRNLDDPDICICNSYKIKSCEEIKEIINILLEYEKENPSSWNRSKESLYNEWIMHNIGFELGIEIHRTRNVDLNNADQEKFESSIIKMILNKK